MQQIYSYYYNVKVGNEYCNDWSDYMWGFQFKQEKIWLGGEWIFVYKIFWDYFCNCVLKRNCVNEIIDRSSCQVVSCVEWKDLESGRYIVCLKEDVIELYYLIFCQNLYLVFWVFEFFLLIIFVRFGGD